MKTLLALVLAGIAAPVLAQSGPSVTVAPSPDGKPWHPAVGICVDEIVGQVASQPVTSIEVPSAAVRDNYGADVLVLLDVRYAMNDGREWRAGQTCLVRSGKVAMSVGLDLGDS